MSQNSYLREFCAQVSQIVFLADLTVLRLITTVWAKMYTKIHISANSCAQVSQIVFLSDLTGLFAKCKKIHMCASSCAQLSKDVSHLLIWPFFGLIQLYISEDVTYILTPRVVCTIIKNRVLSWFDRFTAYYNCMNKNVTKLISPQVLCTSVTNRLLSWFDRFTAYYYCMSKNVTKSYLHEFCAQVSQNVFFADLTVLRLNTTVWAKMSQNS